MSQFYDRRSNLGCRAMLVLLVLLMVPVAGAFGDNHDADSMGWFIPSGTPVKNVYGGVRAGLGDIDYPDSNQDGSVTGVSSDDDDVVSGLFAGYQINDYVAVEGGYRDLGESDFAGTSSGGPSWEAGSVSANLDADGWELGVLGRWPISDRWYLLGYLGWFWWDSEETFVETSGVTVESDSGSDFSLAAGVEYDIGRSDRIVYRFMGAHQEVDDTSYDVNSASAEIVYRFP